MSLTYIGQQCTIYSGFSLLFAGIVGNGMNIWIFLSSHIQNGTCSTFYFLAGSICNGLYLVIILSTRILSVGYGIDLTRTSIAWCKMRTFLVSTLGLISLTCSCLATIDQFLVTSKNVSIRHCSNKKWAYRIVFIMIIIWCLHGIPMLFFVNILSPTETCTTADSIFRSYMTIYALVVLCAIPVLIQIVFGCLAYYNIHKTTGPYQQQVDRQLTIMTLIQVILIVISITLPGIHSAYTLITIGIDKTQDRKTIESFASTIITITSYFYYVGNFYIFLISSSRFRRRVKEKIFCCHGTNRIRPFQSHHT